MSKVLHDNVDNAKDIKAVTIPRDFQPNGSV